jgi:hypothetical protein
MSFGGCLCGSAAAALPFTHRCPFAPPATFTQPPVPAHARLTSPLAAPAAETRPRRAPPAPPSPLSAHASRWHAPAAAPSLGTRRSDFSLDLAEVFSMDALDLPARAAARSNVALDDAGACARVLRGGGGEGGRGGGGPGPGPGGGRNTLRGCVAQPSTAQHSTAQHGTAQHSTARHSTAQQADATPCVACGTPRAWLLARGALHAWLGEACTCSRCD